VDRARHPSTVAAHATDLVHRTRLPPAFRRAGLCPGAHRPRQRRTSWPTAASRSVHALSVRRARGAVTSAAR